MRIKIKNLGPIYEFNFDLNKDLHLVYGKNNIGKSHGIAAVYLILKTFSNFLGNDYNSSSEAIATFDDNSKESLKKIQKSLFERMIIEFFNSIILPNLTTSFANSFSEISNIENKFINNWIYLLIKLLFVH
jgi:predicted ATPase